MFRAINRQLSHQGESTNQAVRSFAIDKQGMSNGHLRMLAAIVLLMMGASLPAAASDDPCDRLFPDLFCDRDARPAGHVAPMSMPYYFEDPYITTELNLVGIYHSFPSDSVFDGGNAGVIALQARLAITDRLGFIATGDGFTILRPDNPILKNAEGFMDVTAGFKYALIDDRELGLIVTPSFRYLIPLGTGDILQGQGKGEIIPAVSVGYGPGAIHVIADLGARIAVDRDKDSTSLFYNIHLDQAFEIDCIPGAAFVVPFIELNAMHWLESGDGSSTINLRGGGQLSVRAAQDALFGGPNSTANLRFEGGDIANLGSSGIAGEHLITMAWGIRIPFDNGISTGLAYERVLSQRQDIFGHRVTAMLSYGF